MTDVLTHMQESLERALKEIPKHIGIGGGHPGPAMIADGKLQEALFYLNAELVLTKFRRLMDVCDFREYWLDDSKCAVLAELSDIKRNMYDGEYLIWYIPPRSSLDGAYWQIWIRAKERTPQAIIDVKKLLAESGLLDGWSGEVEEMEDAYSCIGTVNVW